MGTLWIGRQVSTIVWSLVLKLNFNLHTLITHFYRWPGHTTRWGECIYGVSCGLIGCDQRTWFTTRWWLHSMPRRASRRCKCMNMRNGLHDPSWCLISSLSRTTSSESDEAVRVSIVLPSTTCFWEGYRDKQTGNMWHPGLKQVWLVIIKIFTRYYYRSNDT
jgi:hypothetical protein